MLCLKKKRLSHLIKRLTSALRSFRGRWRIPARALAGMARTQRLTSAEFAIQGCTRLRLRFWPRGHGWKVPEGFCSLMLLSR